MSLMIPLLVALLLPAAGYAQSLYVLSDIFIDEASGNVTATATTSTDYTSGWYYDIGVLAYLRVSPQSGSPYYACSNTNSTNGTYASVTCNHNLGSQSAELELSSYHWLDATYYYYQLQWCTWECYYYDDYLGFSLLGSSGTYNDSQFFYAPGQATPIAQRTAKNAQIYKTRSRGGCVFPPANSEQTYSYGWNQWSPYVAQFQQTFSSGNFNNRLVREEFANAPVDGCWRPANPFAPAANASGQWLVSAIKALDYNGIGAYLYSLSNAWGYDHLGFVGAAGNTRVAAYIQNMRNQPGGGGSCSINSSQSMYMYCGVYGTAPGAYYRNGVPMSIVITANGTFAEMNSIRSGSIAYRTIP